MTDGRDAVVVRAVRSPVEVGKADRGQLRASHPVDLPLARLPTVATAAAGPFITWTGPVPATARVFAHARLGLDLELHTACKGGGTADATIVEAQ